jgi:hypothetical protein
MTELVAIAEMVGRFFGFGSVPNYSGTLEVIQRDPYSLLRGKLAEAWVVEDFTDYNCDLSFVWVLNKGPRSLTLRLSMVAPYAIALESTGDLASDEQLCQTIEEAGFRFLAKEDLQSIVRTPAITGTIYEVLFEFASQPCFVVRNCNFGRK